MDASARIGSRRRRDIMNWSDVETHGRDFLFQAAGSRDNIDARDINRPRFREEPSTRRTDPLRRRTSLRRVFDQVVTRVPKYGHRYERTPEEN